MADGIYTALSGAVAQEHALEVVANNLANVNTTGFKGDQLVFKQAISAANKDPKTASSVHVAVDKIVPDLRQGSMKATNRPLDAALDGPGFFVVATPDGDKLSRDGSFSLRPDGVLEDDNGNLVRGLGGLIRVPYGAPARIDNVGMVYAGDTPLDKLKIVDVQKPETLHREAEGLWGLTESQPYLADTPLQVGALEQGNVNAVHWMVRMVNIQRAYEAYHRSMETINTMEKKLTSEVR